MKRWQVSDQWWRQHTSSDLVYTVVIRVEPPHVAKQLWAKLSADNGPDDDGALAFGGVSIAKSKATFEVCSGGEDALDSLEYGINDVLLETLETLDSDAEWFQVRQTRDKG